MQLSAVSGVARPRKRKPTLSAVRANPGTAAAYRRKLDLLLGEMHNSVLYWLSAAYNQNEPNTTLANDEAPAAALSRVLQALARRWNKNFKEAAPALAEYFATSTKDRADGALKLILKKGGFSVSFTMTPEVRDAFLATVGENVSLIKSIGTQYLSDVEQAVMRSVSAGRDLKSLYDEIGGKVDLRLIGKGRKPGESDKSLLARTRRRVALICRDQNNKATATITRVRQQNLGITQAVWMHSAGGKEPRPEHVAWSREHKRYDLKKGMWSAKDQKYVWPGTAINCRCVSFPVIPGFEDELDDLATDSVAMDATWMESQHPRDEKGQFATVSSGHTKPKPGTLTGKVWDLADKISNEKGGYATSAEVKAAGVKEGLHPGTVSTQFHHWKKFHSGPKSVEINTKQPLVSKKEVEELQAKVKPAAVMTTEQKLEDLNKQIVEEYGFEWNTGVNPYPGTQTYVKGGVYANYSELDGAYIISNLDEEVLAKGAGYLNLLNAIQDQMEGNAPPKPAANPTKIVKALDTLMPTIGFKKEGTFSGIHYFVKGNLKYSYKPSTNSWALLQKGDSGYFNEVKTGDDFLQLSMISNGLGAEHATIVAAQHKAQKEAAAAAVKPIPVEQIGYKEGIPHTDHLPATIKSSITTYTGSSYKGINGALRNPSVGTPAATMRHIQNIQKAFKLSPPTKQQTVVKRGFDFDGLKGMAAAAGLASIDQMTVGMTLQDLGFVSTTHHEKASFGDIKTEITVPVGAKALHIAPISLHKGENETLLPNGSKFVIESIDKHEGTGHIRALRLRMVVE